MYSKVNYCIVTFGMNELLYINLQPKVLDNVEAKSSGERCTLSHFLLFALQDFSNVKF